MNKMDRIFKYKKVNDILTDSPSEYEHRAHLIRAYITSARENLTRLEKECIHPINEIVTAITDSIQNGGKVLICGNGGSASDALHIAAELVGRFRLERTAMPCIALNANMSVLTAVGNDYGYDDTFSRQVEALGAVGDVFIGISTSGNSKNVVKALELARKLGMKTVGMTGVGGGKMKSLGLCDILLAAPSDETSKIQEMHITCGHIICKLVEEIMVEREK